MAAPSNARGILAMLAATGLFIAGDALMKLAMADLPPMQVLVMRGASASILCLPLLLALGHGRQVSRALHPWVLMRATCEGIAVILYVLALARNPLANVVAVIQTTPLFFIMGVALLWGERIGALRWALIGLGFAGAVLAAQPDTRSASAFLALGIGSALFGAGRDLAARRIPSDVPVLVATLTTLVVVMAMALAGSLAFERWSAPAPAHYAMTAGAGFFLIFAHTCLFLAYRFGTAASVAPFFYAFTLWAVLFGFLVFGDLPNATGAIGIGLIAASGLAIVLSNRRTRQVAAA